MLQVNIRLYSNVESYIAIIMQKYKKIVRNRKIKNDFPSYGGGGGSSTSGDIKKMACIKVNSMCWGHFFKKKVVKNL